MKKRIDFVFAGILLAVSALFLGACSAEEEMLFAENSEVVLTEGSCVTSGEEDTGPMAEYEEMPDQTVVFVEDTMIRVHVCGAVMHSGVYELKEGSRVMDAVLAAGGFLQEADEEYVNLATVLADGDKVRIPTRTETMEASENILDGNGVTGTENFGQTENVIQNKVNINTADAEELCTLPGIGQTRAESILSYRKEHGSFSRIEDIMQVSGIKENSFEKIKDKIIVK